MKKSIWDEAKQIDLVDYLNSLGHQPKIVRNHDYWYLSPFRQEKTPSFKVNRKQNVWFDHGAGEGGTIIDLGIRLFRCTYHELIKKLTYGNSILNIPSDIPITKVESATVKLEVLSVVTLQDSSLTSYLEARAISTDLARKYCSEVDFRIDGKLYKSIGFLNKSGGYELRNRWFKGSSSPKDISLISFGTSSSKLSVFEGFIDFLSALTISNPKFIEATNDSGFLVLNSLAFVSREIPLLRSFPEINLFLDNDSAGRAAKERLQSQGVRFQDKSTWYAKHKDVNEYLQSCTLIKKQDPSHPKPRNRLRR